MKRIGVLLIILLIFSLSIRAQYEEDLMFGVKIGAALTNISNTSFMIVSEDYYVGYTFKEEALIRPAAGLFVNYRINSSDFALEGQLNYYQLSSDLVYSDIHNFKYTCGFQYSYLGFGAYIKRYITHGLNMGVGMRFGFNLTPEKMTYTSNSQEIEWGEDNNPPVDSETQADMQSVIKGRNLTEVGMILSYEFACGLSVGLGYHHGLSDVIETLVNRHSFIDSINKTSSIQFSVGWAISVDKSKKDKRRR